MRQAARSYAVGRKILVTGKGTFQSASSWSPREASVGDAPGAEETSGMGRPFRHIWPSPTESRASEQAFFHGPVSEMLALAGLAGSPELGELAGSSAVLGHVARGPKDTPFTFQVDLSNVEANPRWTRETTVVFPVGTEAAAGGAPDHGAWRDGGSGNAWVASVSFQGSSGDGHQVPGEKGKAQAEFDKTVQLQRMVDQRSVISDEKKVALLYLDTQEEENEGHWF